MRTAYIAGLNFPANHHRPCYVIWNKWRYQEKLLNFYRGKFHIDINNSILKHFRQSKTLNLGLRQIKKYIICSEPGL